MATYPEIQKWVKSKHGFVPKTCWIAHCREMCGLPLRTAPNCRGKDRANPCPPDKKPAIMEALRHFGIVAVSSPDRDTD